LVVASGHADDGVLGFRLPCRARLGLRVGIGIVAVGDHVYFVRHGGGDER
jgi:hypothetical protein